MTPSPSFLVLVEDEYRRAVAGHPVGMHSAHEAYAVILEELEEFWEEVRLKREERNPLHMRDELVQVAAMALRAAVELNLMEDGPCRP
jgi:hypothetical protein